MTNHVSQEIRDEIVRAFTQDLETVINLANIWDISRQGIYKILKSAGVDTSKRKMKVSCSACGCEVMRPKSHVRSRKNIFCGTECMRAYRKASMETSRKRAAWHRVARRKILSKFPGLKKEHVVHFIDEKVYNCMESNLMVFKNLGDHARWHRFGEGSGVEVLWRGDKDS